MGPAVFIPPENNVKVKKTRGLNLNIRKNTDGHGDNQRPNDAFDHAPAKEDPGDRDGFRREIAAAAVRWSKNILVETLSNCHRSLTKQQCDRLQKVIGLLSEYEP